MLARIAAADLRITERDTGIFHSLAQIIQMIGDNLCCLRNSGDELYIHRIFLAKAKMNGEIAKAWRI